jgi:signal transduction histidine kinase
MSDELAVSLVLTLTAVGVSLSSIETLIGVQVRPLAGLTGKPFVHWTQTCSWHGAFIVPVLRIATVALLVALTATGNASALIAFSAAAASLLSALLFRTGQDAAEHLAHLVLVATALCHVPSEVDHKYLLVFLAAQSSLAFAVAAVSKLKSPLWGSGEAMVRIVSLSSYGSAWGRALVTKHIERTKNMERGIICLQIMLAVAWAMPPIVCGLVLGCGLMFHATGAFVSGLYKFIWMFAALDVATFWLSCSIWG